jgi:hypothetical protein
LKALHGLRGLVWEVVLAFSWFMVREVEYNSDCAQIFNAQKRNGSSNQTHIHEAFFNGRRTSTGLQISAEMVNEELMDRWATAEKYSSWLSSSMETLQKGTLY